LFEGSQVELYLFHLPILAKYYVAASPFVVSGLGPLRTRVKMGTICVEGMVAEQHEPFLNWGEALISMLLNGLKLIFDRRFPSLRVPTNIHNVFSII
jgi:hypothetical protein